MKAGTLTLVLSICALPAIAAAQTPPPGAATTMRFDAPRAGMQNVVPPFERTLFPPELVMQHQRELALTAEQRRVITDAVKVLQNHSVDLQWNLQAEQTALAELLEQRPIREQEATAQLVVPR